MTMTLSRRKFLKKCAGATGSLLVLSSVYSCGKKADKPNIIIIFTDDQGYQDVGCYGSPLIKTPNLDRMAREGMRFTDFYSSNSICSPSRASLLTGCYPTRVSIPDVLFQEDDIGLNPEEITIADLLKQRGYATACIGKWHLGHKPEFLPTRQGFDMYYGIPYSNDMRIDPTMELSPDIKLNNEMTPNVYAKKNPKDAGFPSCVTKKSLNIPATNRLSQNATPKKR